MPLGAADILIIGLGGVVGLGGLWVLVRLRPRKKRGSGGAGDGGESPPELKISGRPVFPSTNGRTLSEPTRLTIALVLILAGYHIVVWRLPATMTTVQLSRDVWYVWILLGLGLIILSFALDRFERQAGSSGADQGGKPGDGGSNENARGEAGGSKSA